jgi:putative acetyltransferase
MSETVLRDETQADHVAIAELHRAAFGGDYEAKLVDDLRSAGLVVASLVAISSDVLVGHIMFSEISLEIDGESRSAASLAPLSVAQGFRGRGIGSRLVTEGLERVARDGVAAVIVLGSPTYYRRFGFEATLVRHLVAPFRGEAFLGLELVQGALAGDRGIVRYPEAFGLLQPGEGHDLT